MQLNVPGRTGKFGKEEENGMKKETKQQDDKTQKNFISYYEKKNFISKDITVKKFGLLNSILSAIGIFSASTIYYLMLIPMLTMMPFILFYL